MELASDVANAVGLHNYPRVNIQTEAIGKVRNSPHEIISGYMVPVTIPGAYSGMKTLINQNLICYQRRNS